MNMNSNEAAPVRALVWDENKSVKNPAHLAIYPDEIRGAVAAALNEAGGGRIVTRTSCLDDAEQGLSDDLLREADVLLWWGHTRHKEVTDESAERVRAAVHARGMGLILLHSAHASKAYQAVLAATGRLHGGWRIVRPDFEPEEITVCAPRHPIARGIESFTLAQEEMYGSPLGAPCWETLVFQSYFPRGGEYFPGGFALSVGGIEANRGRRDEQKDGEVVKGSLGQSQGAGRVFYFRPGDENVPTYHHPVVAQILVNAVLWAAHRDAEATP